MSATSDSANLLVAYFHKLLCLKYSRPAAVAWAEEQKTPWPGKSQHSKDSVLCRPLSPILNQENSSLSTATYFAGFPHKMIKSFHISRCSLRVWHRKSSRKWIDRWMDKRLSKVVERGTSGTVICSLWQQPTCSCTGLGTLYQDLRVQLVGTPAASPQRGFHSH